jgi:cell division septation protein DedD
MGLRSLIIIVSFLISACGSKVEPKIVQINKTQKIQSTQSWETAEVLRFMWTPPKGPKGNDSKWIINDDIMLLTPDIPGEYSISLIIENMSGDLLGEESFLLIAEESTETSQQVSSPEDKSSSTSPVVKEVKEEKKVNKSSSTPIAETSVKKKGVDNRPYTIQVSAWPSLEEARKDQLSLTKYGIDAYTQRFFLDQKNAYWWRVRVGNFSDIHQANRIKEQIENLHGRSGWIDRINEH